MLSKYAVIGLIIGFFISCGETKKPDISSQKPIGRVLDYQHELQFLSDDGSIISTLNFEKADDPNERNQGLMDVNSMPENAGMVFYFDTEEEQSFWMANTPLALDIMYVNADSIIVSIYRNTVPFSKTSLPSGAPAKYVIETNAGYSANHDIREGGKVRF